MTKLSFEEFSPVSEKQWKQKIQFDLKGADYNKTLLTHTNEGLTINPFYHKDTAQYLPVELPAESFKICQTVFIDDTSIANKLAKEALEKGATALRFIADAPFDFEVLFKDISESCPIFFKFNFLSQSFITDLLTYVKSYKCALNIDIIGHLVSTGNWFKNNANDHKNVAQILAKASKNSSVLAVNVDVYQNAGANTVQQVAYALAHVNEYLNTFESAIFPEPKSKKINVNFAIGNNYFLEIAKLRAFRYLFDVLIKEYKFDFKLSIFAEPSLRNKSIYDYNVNMLRTTTECMSAILGGADVVGNVAYDTIFHKSNAFGERIGRNQLLILQEESYFKEAKEAVKGTLYVETLSVQIAEKALHIFKEIEQKKGFVNQLFAGVIQRKIIENAEKEQIQFDTGESSFIGVNKYPNLQDTMGEDLELYPFVKINPHKTLIQPIISKRLAEKLEQERLAKENV
ncbi:MAG: methylmalonyl-CoA mutase subunit beta [Flavobacteriaceae bacterium]